MNKIYDEITIVTVLYNSAKIDESFSSELRKLNPDIFLVCAFGSILSEKIINKILLLI